MLTALTKSVSSPSLLHSNVPSILLLSDVWAAGNESSNDVRGAGNGNDDLEDKLESTTCDACIEFDDDVVE